MMKIEKPIFVIGVGRSGSTIFHKIFSEHPQVAWLSTLCNRYPDNPSINRFLMRVIDYPVVGSFLKKIIEPDECYDFWERHCKGFRQPCRDLLPEDVTNKIKRKIQKVMSENLTNKRRRLMLKITGWPRMGFLHEIFPDAKFIHISRDGRAVVNSMINVHWWWGWRGPQNWRWGELTQSQKQEWERYDRSFIVLAAIEWRILMDSMEKAKGYIDKKDFLDVKYEDLCSDPPGVFKGITEFCDLRWPKGFENSIKKYPLIDTNYKWREELTDKQKKVLEEVLQDYLKRYDYL
jgi:hypothetical protein